MPFGNERPFSWKDFSKLQLEICKKNELAVSREIGEWYLNNAESLHHKLPYQKPAALDPRFTLEDRVHPVFDETHMSALLSLFHEDRLRPTCVVRSLVKDARITQLSTFSILGGRNVITLTEEYPMIAKPDDLHPPYARAFVRAVCEKLAVIAWTEDRDKIFYHKASKEFLCGPDLLREYIEISQQEPPLTVEIEQYREVHGLPSLSQPEQARFEVSIVTATVLLRWAPLKTFKEILTKNYNTMRWGRDFLSYQHISRP